MNIRDQAAWDKWEANNRDGYGRAVIVYAREWAESMDREIAKGRALTEVFEDGKLSAAADDHPEVGGITGFMYGAVISVLSTTWAHGEALRQWHNLKTQIGNEGEKANASGGVLNPALLNID